MNWKIFWTIISIAMLYQCYIEWRTDAIVKEKLGDKYAADHWTLFMMYQFPWIVAAILGGLYL